MPPKTPRRPGRAPTLKDAKIFPLILEKEARVALDRIAVARGLTTAALIRDVLNRFLEREARK